MTSAATSSKTLPSPLLSPWLGSLARAEWLKKFPTTNEQNANDSIACWVAGDKGRLEDFLARTTRAQQAAARYTWAFYARPKQLPPTDGDWRFWIVQAGRGFGKTKVGAEWVRAECESNPKARIALVAATRTECRDTMIEGESGLLACCPPWNMPKYYPSRLLLIWKNGARAKGYGAEKPERLRGQNITGAWCDEFGAWSERTEDGQGGPSADRVDSWKNLKLSLRKGNCRCVITTTPRRKKRLKQLLESAAKRPKRYRITRGSTYENLANLSGAFDEVIEDLEGTRVGRQELEGEYLEDVDGALWTEALIEVGDRVDPRVPIEELNLVRIAIGVDPSTTTGSDSDPSGIVVNGIDKSGTVYVLEDASDKYAPPQWGRKVLDLAEKYRKLACLPWKAVVVILETNKIGQMAEHNVRMCLKKGEKMPKIETTHSSDAKEIRAEPFVALYEKGRVRHYGKHEGLETCMTTWVPGTTTGSPDPLDAHVHSLRELVPNFGKPRILEKKAA